MADKAARQAEVQKHEGIYGRILAMAKTQNKGFLCLEKLAWKNFASIKILTKNQL